MALSGSQQDDIQRLIDGHDDDASRDVLRRQAESTLVDVRDCMSDHVLNADEIRAAETAIEILVRLESTAAGKGAFFRLKRRVQLTKVYLG